MKRTASPILFIALTSLACACSASLGSTTPSPDGSDPGSSPETDAEDLKGRDSGAWHRDSGSDTAVDANTLTDTGAGTTDTGTGAQDTSAPGAIWQPTPGTSWQWQLSGTLDTSLQVAVYDIDLFDNSAATIASLKSRGVKVVCYVDAGSYEPNRPDSSAFPSAVLGKVMDGWPDEKWLDIRAQAVRDLIAKRFDVAAQKGCDGVEPDNVDGYSNSTGFPLTAADQLAYNRFLADAAHARGLSVALKNDLDQVTDLVTTFDFALNEQCFQYSECDKLTPFIQANKAVLEVEYGADSLATSVCPQANARNFDTLITDLNLTARRVACR
jgi:hypothetical protein